MNKTKQNKTMAKQSMPQINIECLPSMKKYLKKMQTNLEIKQDKYAMIERGKISLKFININNILIIKKQFDDNYKINKFTINTIPKQYHYLYWYLHKIIKKLRAQTTKYTIIRYTESDKMGETNIICLISINNSYTIHFKNGTIAFLKNINDKSIKFIDNKNKIKKNISFIYNKNCLNVKKYNDAFDRLRKYLNEFIHCKQLIQKQKIKQGDYSKTWKIKWNADSGSVQDINDNTNNNNNNNNNNNKYNYISETTLSSDLSDTNSEIPRIKINNNNNNNNNDNKSLSTVQATSSTLNSGINSEASWRD